MDLILLVSIALRTIALALAIRLWRRVRAWQMGVFAAMVAMALLRAALTATRGRPFTLEIARLEELPGLVVSLLFIATVMAASDYIERQRSLAERFRRSQEQYRELFEHAVDVVLVTDAAGTILDVNRRGVEMFGYDAGEFRGLQISELIAPESLAEQPIDYEALLAGRVVETERPFVRKDGSQLWVRTHARQLPDGRILGILRDVTAMRAAQDELERTASELERSHALLTAVIEGTDDAIFVKDLEGRYLMINSAGARQLGRPVEEVLGQTDEAFFSPQLATQIRAHDRAVIELGEPHTVEEPGEPEHGRTYSVMRGPWRDEQGRIIGVVGIARDITERRRAEDALRASEGFLRLSQQIGHVGSWEWDVDAGTVKWSDEMYRIHGISVDGFAGTPDAYLPLVHPDDRERVSGIIEDLLSGGRPRGIEYRIVRPDGRVREVFGTNGFRTDPATGRRSVVGTVHDMTDLKRVERELRATTERLELALAAARMGTWEWDAATGSMRWSEGIEAVLGVAPETVPGGFDAYLQLIHEDDRERVRQRTEETVAGHGSEYEIAFRIPSEDGSVRWLGAKGRVYRDPSGSATRLVGTVADVTESKKAEEALRASEELFRSAFNQAVAGIALTAPPDGRFTQVNQALCDMLGYMEEELLTRTVASVTHPSDIERSKQVMGQLLRGETDRVHLAKRYVRKDGSVMWGDLSVTMVTLPGGAGSHYLALVTDVTEQKRAEMALRDSEERFRSLVEHAPEAIVILDAANGRFVSANRHAENIFGLSQEQLVRVGPAEVSPPVQPDGRPSSLAARTYIEEALAGGTPVFEWVHRNASGRDIQCEIRLLKLPGTDTLVRGSIVDISVRKGAEEELRREKAQFETLFEGAPEAIALVERDGRVVRINSEFVRLFGYTQEEAAGRSLDDLIAVDELYAEAQQLTANAARGEIVAAETVRRSRDGRLIDVSVLGAPIHVEGGLAGVLGIYRDISERKAAESALRASETRFRAVIENSFDVIALFDAAGSITYISPSVERVLGYEPTELIGRVGREIVHPNDHERASHAFRECLRHPNETILHTLRLRRADGSYRLMEIVDTNLLDDASVGAVVSNLRDITEREKAERALRESEQRYRTLFENSPVGIGVADAQGTLIAYNPAMLVPGGYTDADIASIRNVAGLYADAAEREAVLAELREHGAVRGREVRFRRKGGGTYDAALSLTPITLDGAPAVLAIVQDITERKDAERALLDSERRYREIFDLAPVSLWEEDYSATTAAIREVQAQGVQDMRAYFREHPEFVWECIRKIRVLDVNQATLELYGVSSKDELVGSLVPLVGPESLPTLVEQLVAIAERREFFEADTVAAAPRGRPLYLRIRIRFPADPSEIRNVLVSITDLTERKAVEDAFERQTAFTRQLLDTTTDGFILADAEGRILEANPAYCRLVRYSESELRALTIADIEAQFGPQEIPAIVNRMLQEGGGRFETRHRRKDGTVIPLDVSATVAERDGQRVVGAFVRDISARVRAEEAIRRSREEMRQLARRLEQVREEERTLMAREIHDELGQALTALKLDLSWLVGRLPKTWRHVRERATVTLASVDGAIDTVRDLATRLRPAVLDDLGLVAAIEWQARELFGRAGIACDLRLNATVDDIDRERATALFRIFQETCTNILRHAEASAVAVSLVGDEASVTLTVRDNGRGITPHHSRHRGSLGLLGMRERALSLGGRLDVARVPEGGTEIVVRVPRSMAERIP